jgi:hypothetical protein
MICCKCERHLTRCICEDIDERLEKLRESRFLAIDVDAIKATRFLDKFKIDRDRESERAKSQPQPGDNP